jgi:signal transduction histidine kinase
MPINARLPLPQKTLFRLRSILLVVMFAVLALPLGGLYFFRIYENGLVQQTELELISQSAVLSATFRQMVRDQLVEHQYGYVVFSGSPRKPEVPPASGIGGGQDSLDSAFNPVMPKVDLIGKISPPRPPARPSIRATDPLAHKLGERMKPIIQDTQQVTLAGVRLLDMNGTVIGGHEEVGLSLAHVPEVKQALQGQYASVIRRRLSDEPPPPVYSVSRGTNIRVFTAFPIIEKGRLQGVVYLSRTPTNIIKHLYAERGTVLLATLSLLGLAVLLVLFVSSTISRPIRELLKQTERVRQGEQRVVEPLKNPVTREVAQLSESFAGMSQALAERSDYIRRFATHVSHEFKTPLTGMQGALELLLDHFETMPPERRQHFISNLLADTQRLKQLVNRLLELARADALEPSRQTSTLPDMFKAVQNRYQERGLELNLTSILPDTPLAIAPDALEAVITNLLDNSLQHGATQVELHVGRQTRRLRLYVHDNGGGVSPANRDKIFTPFFTTRRNKGGTGLGLEIIVSILKAYGGTIRLGDVSYGAEFILELPLESAKNVRSA